MTGTPRKDTPAKPDDRQQFVVFALDGQQYGIDIMSVREIRMMQPITFLPGAPEHICGVINLRGSIVPVCDLRVRFAETCTEPSQSHAIVIVAHENRQYGLIVDEVLDIAAIAGSDIAPVPEVQADKANPLFRGLVTATSGLLILLDLGAVLRPDDETHAGERAA